MLARQDNAQLISQMNSNYIYNFLWNNKIGPNFLKINFN